MATNRGRSTIAAVSIEELARAARPQSAIDGSSTQLLEKELETLKSRRSAHHLGEPSRDDLTGLALSGGGIRSATFCLGALQALARQDLLKHFDYLSTVSGGGYLGGSLGWWWSGRWRPASPPAPPPAAQGAGLAEEQAPFPAPPAQAQAADPQELGVGPRNFPYGADSPTIWRGQIGDGTELGPEILTYLRKHGNYLTPGGGLRPLSLVSVMIRAIALNLFVWLPLLTAAMLGLLSLLWWLFPVGPVTTAAPSPDSAAAVGAPILSQATLEILLVDALITTALIVAMTLAYFGLTAIVPAAADDTAGRSSRGVRLVQWLTAPWGAWLVGIGIFLVWLLWRSEPQPPDYWQGLRLLLLAAGILATTFLFLCLIYSLATWLTNWLRFVSYRMRRLFEIWAAVYLTLIAVLAIIGATPDVERWLTESGGSQTAGMAQETGGVLALLAGLVGAGIAFVRSGSQVTETFRSMGFEVPGGVVASIAAALLLFGIVLITHAVAVQVNADQQWAAFWIVIVVAVGAAWLVNGNHVSLGRFYRDRLMEAFMPGYQAVLTKRTGPAPAEADAMRLHQASPSAPYHIVNTNVILINARNRRRCIRGGDSFILTRDWCGSNATGWRATREFMNDGMTLPTAVAISGAAANPNTGVGGVGLTRSRVVSTLMALLNLRLGYWVPHPRHGRQSAVPNHVRPGLLALLGGYHEDYGFQELSDGGHFENLGLYELIRRRLRLIVVCDGGQDRGYQFEDLQTALRRIGEDFGAKVQFLPRHPMEDIIPQPGVRTYPRGLELARRGFAVADVYYPPDFDADGHIRPDADPARLIYLKATIVDQLPLELLGYRGKNPDFPNQSTGDQFFDEDQFEAYRELGYRIAEAMITGVGLHALLQDG